MNEMPCIHVLAEQETACADGMCPLCLVVRVKELEELCNNGEANEMSLATELQRLKMKYESPKHIICAKCGAHGGDHSNYCEDHPNRRAKEVKG